MPSAYSVPMASDVLPDPDTPTTATVRHSGTSTSTSRRLLCRAPRTPIAAGSVSGPDRSAVGISPPLRFLAHGEVLAPRRRDQGEPDLDQGPAGLVPDRAAAAGCGLAPGRLGPELG